ncbi:TetR/AcrR family transcriptional regulator [Rhizobium leguminosarum]|nr:TetR/AcrR family transcriptional regulator [Rhizobium leguminosarum]NEH73441.1 TetR family transcriptional regulator [Rhizobium leguminosarum]NKL38368.1 TetR family transcriptional regulator [Rhizobium leguminosarum bv. viciae]
MNVFWDRGYHDAALPDLLNAMEISKGSFYKAFGDKKAIFLRALELYSDDAAQSIRKVLASDPSPKIAIRNAFLRFADLSSGTKGRRGCFAVLTATEMLPGDTQSADLVRRHYKRLQDLFTQAVREGQAAGEIDEDVDPEAISHFIIAHAQGMRVLGKLGSTRKQTLEGVDLIMRMLF